MEIGARSTPRSIEANHKEKKVNFRNIFLTAIFAGA